MIFKDLLVIENLWDKILEFTSPYNYKNLLSFKIEPGSYLLQTRVFSKVFLTNDWINLWLVHGIVFSLRILVIRRVISIALRLNISHEATWCQKPSSIPISSVLDKTIHILFTENKQKVCYKLLKKAQTQILSNVDYLENLKLYQWFIFLLQPTDTAISLYLPTLLRREKWAEGTAIMKCFAFESQWFTQHFK